MSKSIFIIGGYGYRNVGDEGQVGANIQQITQLFPKHKLIVASPNVEYTKRSFPGLSVVEALRSCFFKQKKSRVYQIVDRNKKSTLKYVGNELYKLLFLLQSVGLIVQTNLMVHGYSVRIVNRSTFELLRALESSDILFFSGGGYMTEPTLSRLWDGFLHIYIASRFGLSVYMSGQTIGPINGYFNRRVASYLFNKVDYIATRDPEASIIQLNDLRVEKERFGVVCDDATFFHSENGTPIAGKYIAYQCHYWGAGSIKDEARIVEHNISIIKGLISKGYKVVLVSMTPSDERTIEDISKKFESDRLVKAHYRYDCAYVVSIFKNAHLTVTMKHHPIVFSLGNSTPVISLNFSRYYHHKNSGALKLFGLGHYAYDFSEPVANILAAVDKIEANYQQIMKELTIRSSELYKARAEFLKLLAD